jgi:hypothetical protein
MTPFSSAHSTAYLPVISAMITPAMLILAAGSLVNSTLMRLARIVDRTRVLIDTVAACRARNDCVEVETALSWFPLYQRRVFLVERALTLFHTAIGMFVACSLSITIDHFIPNAPPLPTILLVVTGAILLLIGTVTLVVETHVAAGSLRREIEIVLK